MMQNKKKCTDTGLEIMDDGSGQCAGCQLEGQEGPCQTWTHYLENPKPICYDKYDENPDIFDAQTMLTFDDDNLSVEDAAQLQEIIRMSLDWKGIARVMSKDMPSMVRMMERGLRKAHYDPAVQSALAEFLNVLIQTADRRLLVNPSVAPRISQAICGECGSPTASHAEWCPLEHWKAAANKRTKKLKKRRNPSKKKSKKKKKYKCKKCGKNVKQKKRGRPKLSHSRCKSKR